MKFNKINCSNSTLNHIPFIDLQQVTTKPVTPITGIRMYLQDEHDGTGGVITSSVIARSHILDDVTMSKIKASLSLL